MMNTSTFPYEIARTYYYNTYLSSINVLKGKDGGLRGVQRQLTATNNRQILARPGTNNRIPHKNGENKKVTI